ncbi:MAG: hypothetical protein U0K23_10245 [Selenomonadaceae bacterium]|nr:hypothetical protein [Selenomonadaceae bacterium]
MEIFVTIIMSFIYLVFMLPSTSAMTMGESVKVGDIVGVNIGGFRFKQCNSNKGALAPSRNTYKDKYISGVATFGTLSDKLHLYYQDGSGKNRFTKFGGADINNTYDIEVILMSIDEIKTDEGITLYLLNDGYEYYDSVEYTLLGRRPDGKYVKYFSTKETVMNYFYTDTGYPKYGAYSPQISKDTISFKLTNWDGSKLVGEIVYKWDNNAQWFSVAVNQY